MEVFQHLAAIFIGWIIGFGTFLITEWLRNRSRGKKFKRLCAVELRALQKRLVTLAYRMVGRFLGFDENFLKWFVRKSEELAIFDPDAQAELHRVLGEGAEAIAKWSEFERAPPKGAITRTQFSLPFLMANLDAVMLMDNRFSKHLVEIVASSPRTLFLVP